MTTKTSTTVHSVGRTEPHEVANKNKQTGTQGRYTETDQQSNKTSQGDRQNNALKDRNQDKDQH